MKSGLPGLPPPREASGDVAASGRARTRITTLIYGVIRERPPLTAAAWLASSTPGLARARSPMYSCGTSLLPGLRALLSGELSCDRTCLVAY